MSPGLDTALSRFRPAVLAVTAAAVCLTAYYIHQSLSPSDESGAAQLRRRNAIHHSSRPRRRLPRRSSQNPNSAQPRESSRSPSTQRDVVSIPPEILLEIWRQSPRNYGDIQLSAGPDFVLAQAGENGAAVIPLVRPCPTPDTLAELWELPPGQAEAAHRDYTKTLMVAFLCTCLPPRVRLRDLPRFVNTLCTRHRERLNGDSALRALEQFNEGTLPEVRAEVAMAPEQELEWWARWGPQLENAPEQDQGALPPPASAAEDGAPDSPTGTGVQVGWDLDDGGSDTTSHGGDRAGGWGAGADDAHNKEGQSLLNMLYHITEEQSRREGYVHRGVSCNGCGLHPIRGVRYRCANCVDYDLCEACETLQQHTRTHIFYKIRIPAPYLGNPRQPQPVWYPGRGTAGLPSHLSRETRRMFEQRSGFDTPEIDALWDQFRCLAPVEWPDDPHRFGIAIDRDTFDRCFMPTRAAGAPPRHAPPTLLIYDRMFTFYDTNADGLIGFEEFLLGLAAMRSKNPDERRRRVFLGYDHDRDGHVARRDFLLMFRAFYALTKELAHDMFAGIEDELLEGGDLRATVAGTQPVSAAYTGSIPYPEARRRGEGKAKDAFGENVLMDDRPVILDESLDEGDPNEVIGAISEFKSMGARSPSWASSDGNSSWPGSIDEMLETVREATRQPNGHPRSSSPERTEPNGDAVRPRSAGTGAEIPENSENPPDLPDPALPSDVPMEGDGAAATRPLSASSSDPALSNPPPRGSQNHDSRERPRRRRDGPPSEGRPTGYRARQRQQREREEDAARRRAARDLGVQRRWARRQFYLDERIADTEDPPLLEHSRSQPPDDRIDGAEPSGSWLRFPPPLEQDVGREVLYQITQEGLNELLDPLFKLREDLAVEVLRTAGERARAAADLRGFAGPMVRRLCELQVRRAQSRWRASERSLAARFRVRDELMRMIVNQRTPRHPERMQHLHDMRDIGIMTDEQLDAELRKDDWGIVPDKNSMTITGALEPEDSEGRDELPSEDNQSSDLPIEPATPDVAEVDPDAVTRGKALSIQDDFPVPTVDSLPHPDEVMPSTRNAIGPFTTALEDAVMNTDIQTLLESAGYVPPPRRSSISTTPPPDPTLPQNRPNAVSVPAPKAKDAFEKQPPDDIRKRDAYGDWTAEYRDRLKYLTMLEVVAAEDEERGGGGKLSFDEFEEILKGPRGQSLKFLGSWIELVNF